MTPHEYVDQLAVERAKQWIMESTPESWINTSKSWRPWSLAPTDRIRSVLEQCRVDQHVEDVVGFLFEHSASVNQTLVLLRLLESLKDDYNLDVGELVLGTDVDGSSQLELYVRVRGSLNDLYAVREIAEKGFNERFSGARHYIALVALRRPIDV